MRLLVLRGEAWSGLPGASRRGAPGACLAPNRRAHGRRGGCPIEVEPGYVVEGDVLLPARVAEFAAGREGKVRACFLGYSRCAAEAKRACIRSFPSAVNDWVAVMSDRDLAKLVTEMQVFSRELEAECDRCGLAYFDGGATFGDALGKAEEYLLRGAR